MWPEDLRLILEAAERITARVGSLGFREFKRNHDLAVEVAREFEVIGAAVKRIPAERRRSAGTIPWGEMAAFRERMLHEMKHELMWRVIKDVLPHVIGEIRHLLPEAPDPS